MKLCRLKWKVKQDNLEELNFCRPCAVLRAWSAPSGLMGSVCIADSPWLGTREEGHNQNFSQLGLRPGGGDGRMDVRSEDSHWKIKTLLRSYTKLEE